MLYHINLRRTYSLYVPTFYLQVSSNSGGGGSGLGVDTVLFFLDLGLDFDLNTLGHDLSH